MNILQKLSFAFFAVLSFAANASTPITSTDNYFTMIDPGGSFVGGADDVSFDWDGSLYTDPITQTSPNMFAYSVEPQPFFGFPWVIHNARVFGPGDYVFPTTRGNTLSLEVGENQVGTHYLFDWNGNNNIDVVLLWDVDGTYLGSSGPGNDLGSKGWIFNLASVDGDGDGISGIPMADGPFTGFSINLNINPIAAPATLSIVIPDGDTQECTDIGSSTIPMNAEYTIPDTDALDTISWTLDGNPAASGESVDILVPLGIHTVEATLYTVLGEITSVSTAIAVEDTTVPIVSPRFLDRQTGEPLSSVSNKQAVTTDFNVTDVCDDAPQSQGAVTPTFGVSNGGTLKVNASKMDYPTTALELSVTATDAAGNTSSGQTTVLIY
jgi:hypothetical protein